MLFANEYGLRRVRHRIDQNVGMRRYDKLASFRSFSEQGGNRRQNVGMQAKFGLFNAHQRWRHRVAKNAEQAQVTQRAIRQTGRRYGHAALVQENLDSTALNLNVVVVDAGI